MVFLLFSSVVYCSDVFCVVNKVYLLLLKWSKLSPEDALELLHYKYADIAVRLLAVKCLEVLR